MATIKLEVVSPDQMVCSEDIAMLIVRSTGGELGILPRHAPLVTGLMPHAMRIKPEGGGEERLIAVSGGFMEVTPEKITVLANSAETAESIDVERARKGYRRAKERIEEFKRSGPEASRIDIHRAEIALQRAIARLKAAKVDYDE